jgi:hypothetical protein
MFDVRNLVSIERTEEDFKHLIVQELLPNETWRTFNKLKPEVYDWLINNIKDEKPGLKGWCCGNNEYNSNGEGFSLFFYRRKDAKAFIKTWSVHKKATETYNQNTYTLRVLDKKTNTLKIVKR